MLAAEVVFFYFYFFYHLQKNVSTIQEKTQHSRTKTGGSGCVRIFNIYDVVNIFKDFITREVELISLEAWKQFYFFLFIVFEMKMLSLSRAST